MILGMSKITMGGFGLNSMLYTAFFPGLFYNLEDGSDIFLQKAG
jgi:hypothetical protein